MENKIPTNSCSFCRTSFKRKLILGGKVQDVCPMSFLLIGQSKNTGEKYFCTKNCTLVQTKVRFLIPPTELHDNVQEWPKCSSRNYPLLARKCLTSSLLHEEWHWEDFIKNPKSLLRSALVTYSFVILTTKMTSGSSIPQFSIGAFLISRVQKDTTVK